MKFATSKGRKIVIDAKTGKPKAAGGYKSVSRKIADAKSKRVRVVKRSAHDHVAYAVRRQWTRGAGD